MTDQLSRRGALGEILKKSALLTGLSFVLPNFLASGQLENSGERKDVDVEMLSKKWFNEKVEAPLRQIKSEEEKQNFLKTFLQSILYTYAEKILAKVIEKTGEDLSVQNDRKSIEKEIAKIFHEDKAIFTMHHIEKVFMETIIYQLVPSVLTDKFLGKGLQMSVGIPVSIFFAAMHNIGYKDDEGLKFEGDFIPWAQFLQGIFYWYLMRKAGPASTMLAHGTHNFVVLGEILLKNLSEKK